MKTLPLTAPGVGFLASVFVCHLAIAQPKTFTNALGIEFVLIPAGSFMMGTEGWREGPRHEKPPPHFQFDEYWDLIGSVLSNELPRHRVTISKPFYMGKCEVTQAQWEEVMGYNPSRFHKGTDLPVVGPTWLDVQRFIKKLNEQEGRTLYRLPTEAEWEYAAGGPEHLRWPWGNKFDASLSAASAADVQPVGSYPGGASPFGLLDMAGNVAEWVWDTYSPDYYANATALNPENSAPNEPHIYRGGSYANTDGAFYTTTHRYINAKGNGFYDTDIGFRCAQSAVAETRRRSAADRVALLANFCALYTSYKPGATCP